MCLGIKMSFLHKSTYFFVGFEKVLGLRVHVFTFKKKLFSIRLRTCLINNHRCNRVLLSKVCIYPNFIHSYIHCMLYFNISNKIYNATLSDGIIFRCWTPPLGSLGQSELGEENARLWKDPCRLLRSGTFETNSSGRCLFCLVLGAAWKKAWHKFNIPRMG